jgi:hypothetical protein
MCRFDDDTPHDVAEKSHRCGPRGTRGCNRYALLSTFTSLYFLNTERKYIFSKFIIIREFF